MTLPTTPHDAPSGPPTPAPHAGRLPRIAAGDIDGFFGLALDNLIQMLLLMALCQFVVGLSAELVVSVILPGTAISVLGGNLFYAWQAHQLARREGRDDVTALPYGINTVSLIIYVFFVLKPEYDATLAATGGDATAAGLAAWRMGCLACLGSAVIELAGAFVAEPLRRATPRVALLSTLAGIAIGFIAMTFALDIWAFPLTGLLPLGLILVTYFSGVRLPLPGGLLAVLAGTALAWLGTATGIEPLMSADRLAQQWTALTDNPTAHLPVWSAPALFAGLTAPDLGRYAMVIIPMGLFNLVGSLQNLESAQAAGDRYSTWPSLAVNGLGSLAAGLLGSPFPTTIYIGHPGWKALGSRAAYSSLSGLFVAAIGLTGTAALVAAAVPVQAGYAIVFWIGIVITAQAFTAVPTRHAPAAAIGLFPALVAWGLVLVQGTLMAAAGAAGVAGRPAPVTLADLLAAWQANAWPEAGRVNGFLIHAMIVLDRGYIFTAMILAAVSALLIDGRLRAAATWFAVAGVLTLVGVLHSYRVTGNAIDVWYPGLSAREGAIDYWAWPVAIGYGLCAATLAALSLCRPSALPEGSPTPQDC